MKIEYYRTEYKISKQSYSSEIFLPESITNIGDVLSQRRLPKEISFGESVICYNNGPSQGFKKILSMEKMSYYILKGKKKSAIHRLFYLMNILGMSKICYNAIKDNGFAHQLLHEDGYQRRVELSEMADNFESSVPGTYLWALSKING